MNSKDLLKSKRDMIFDESCLLSGRGSSLVGSAADDRKFPSDKKFVVNLMDAAYHNSLKSSSFHSKSSRRFISLHPSN